jgi:putative glycosyltransferase (TIGR04372 family)
MPDNLQLIIEGYKYGSSGRDPNNLFRKYKPPSFDLNHILETKEELKKYGWKNEGIATLIIRDTAYLENYINKRNKYNKIDFSYHDYRDSDIDCYAELIELITKENFLARVGQSSHKSFQKGLKRMDFTKIKKEGYLDYIIPTLSDYIITTGTGIDTIGYVFNIPLMFVNSLPVSRIQSSCNLYFIPKKLFYLENGEELSLRDYVKCCYLKSDEYFKNGIGIESRKGNELIEYFEEFKKLFLSKKDGREAYERLNNEERDLICEFYNLRSSLVFHHGDISIDNVYKNSFPSPIWLRSIKR